MRTLLIPFAIFAIAFSACTPKKIPGTDIDDTTETQAVLETVRKYRTAVEAKNIDNIFKLVDPSFRDDGGSALPDDDLDYDSLKKRLTARMGKISEMKLEVTVRRIEFDEEEKMARVTYSYQLSFKMPEYNSRTQSENDIKQMLLKRVGDNEWKIASGI